MSYEWFIAWRYLKGQRVTFFKVTTYISIVGVTLGVAALIVTLSLMNGFAKEIRDQLVGMNAHLWFNKYDRPLSNWRAVMDSLEGAEHITGISPTVYSETVIRSRRGMSLVGVKGVDPKTVDQVSYIKRLMERDTVQTMGSFDLQSDLFDSTPGMLLGLNIAQRLDAWVGSDVWLYSPPTSGQGPMNFMQQRLHPFRVTGVFRTGFYEFDDKFAVVDIPQAQRVFGLGEAVTQVEAKLDDAFLANTLKGDLLKKVGGYPITVQTWSGLNRHLFEWLAMEKWAAFVVLTLIVLVAAANIVSTLIMIVLEKTREIGILKAMGVTSGGIGRIFVLEGLVVGLVGTTAGGIVGSLLCWLQDTYQLVQMDAQLYYVSAIPVDFQLSDAAAIIAATNLLCLVAGLYPAWRAGTLHPVEAIHHE